MIHWLPLFALLVGCLPDHDGDGTIRVACLGDSNTQAGWSNPQNPPIVRWCAWAQTLAPTRVRVAGDVVATAPAAWINLGAGGATKLDPGLPWPWGGPQAAAALKANADVVVKAMGLNDVRLFNTSPADMVLGCLAIRDAVAPRPMWVVTLPQTIGFDVTAHNEALKTAFPGRWIDGTTGLTTTSDGVHLDGPSQATLAQRVVAAVQ